MIRRRILVITALSLLLAFLLAFDIIPFLRGGFGWQWPYKPAPLERATPLILAIVIYTVGSWLLLKRVRRTTLLLGWAMLGSLVIPLTVVALRSDDVVYELFARTVSGVTTGPHMVAAELDWNNGEWRDWPAVMESYEGRSVHVRLSPPGLPMWYGLLNAIFENLPGLSDGLHRALLPYQCHNWNLLAYTPAEWASASFGMLMPVWAALTVLPLYGVTRRLIGQDARIAVLWWPLVPGLAMFVPTWNTVYPLLSLLAFWSLLVGLERRTIWLVMSGLLTGLLTFANFSLVPLIAFLGIFTLLDFYQRERATYGGWTQLVAIGIWFTLGFVLPWLIFGLFTGQTPFDLLRAAMSAHLALDRPYIPWLWLHFWEWALFAGVPLVLIWLTNMWKYVGGNESQRQLLPITLLLTMALLLLSGTARGETGRVWLFFAPFLVIIAADAVSPDIEKSRSGSAWLAIAIGQAAILVALAMTWAVIDAPDITPRPTPPGGLATTQPANAIFIDSLRLVSWDAEAGDNAITLKLDWQAMQQITTPYWFSALLVTPEGSPVADSVVWQPLDTHYPTTCWTANEWVGDTVTISLPDNAPAGEWWISLAAFADTEHPEHRLPVTLADGTQDTQVGLGPVIVP